MAKKMTPNQKAYQKELGRLQRANQRLGSNKLSESEFAEAFKAPARITKADIERLQGIKGKGILNFKPEVSSDAETGIDFDINNYYTLVYNNFVDELDAAWEEAGRWADRNCYNNIVDVLNEADSESKEVFIEWAKLLKEMNLNLTYQHAYNIDINESWCSQARALISTAYTNVESQGSGYSLEPYSVPEDFEES